MEQTPSSAQNPPARGLAAALTILLLLLAIAFAWMYRRMEQINHRVNNLPLGQATLVDPMATTTDALPDGKGEFQGEQLATSTVPSTEPSATSTFMMDGDWYVARSIPIQTQKGLVIVRHECDQEPKIQQAVNPDSTYDGPLCFGHDQLVLTDPAGKATVIATSTSKLPYPSRVLEAAWIETLGNGDQLVSIGFVWHPCYAEGSRCNASMPYLQPSYVYAVEQNKTYPINVMLGDYARLIWGGTGQAIVIQTCGPGGCNQDPHELRLLNLATGKIDALTTLKANYDDACSAKTVDNQGCATKDMNGKATAYWKSVRWANATTIEAVYVGANGRAQTLKLHP